MHTLLAVYSWICCNIHTDATAVSLYLYLYCVAIKMGNCGIYFMVVGMGGCGLWVWVYARSKGSGLKVGMSRSASAQVTSGMQRQHATPQQLDPVQHHSCPLRFYILCILLIVWLSKNYVFFPMMTCILFQFCNLENWYNCSDMYITVRLSIIFACSE